MGDELNQHSKQKEATVLKLNTAKDSKRNNIRFSHYASPVGTLLLKHNGHSIQQIKYIAINEPSAHEHALSPLPIRWQQYLNAYFCGYFDAIKQLPVRLEQGTVFQQQVWLALRKIKPGQTLNFKQLAILLKRPNAVLAVGQALKRNPVAIVLPCHRVIQQAGMVSAYDTKIEESVTRKHFLLWHEGVVLEPLKDQQSVDSENVYAE